MAIGKILIGVGSLKKYKIYQLWKLKIKTAPNISRRGPQVNHVFFNVHLQEARSLPSTFQPLSKSVNQ